MTLASIKRRLRWRLKQVAAGESRYYGDGGTIHQTGHLDVETHHGTVVAVWFRCQQLPFQQTEVDGERATEMETLSHGEVREIRVTGIELRQR